jgi:chromosomal replication initiator protein
MVNHSLWQGIIQRVIAQGGSVIRPWFTDLEPISLEHGLLEILVPGQGEQDYARKHATRLFTEAAQQETGRLVGVCFLTQSQTASDAARQDASRAEAHAIAAELDSVQLNDDYTFDAFVIGPSNRLAYAACQAVGESPGKAYNPLFIHGSAGLGKTHLLHATGGKIRRDDGGSEICLLSCEMFVNHFINAVERGKLHDFRYRYRHADVLIIDDIQFLADHEQTQEEFFHTFNTLYQDDKQIILSSDRGPSDLQNLEERLISRFNWGLVARIDRPSYETRVAIIKKKARLRGLEVPDDVACFIAGRVESNTRELEGAIAKVAMLGQVLDQPLSMRLAEEALGADPDTPRREVTIEDILRVVTARYNVRVADLQSKKRSRSIALPRQICMYLARNLTRHSLEEIGGYFGGRDHTTVLHANRTIECLREGDAQLQATLEKLSLEAQSNS